MYNALKNISVEDSYAHINSQDTNRMVTTKTVVESSIRWFKAKQINMLLVSSVQNSISSTKKKTMFCVQLVNVLSLGLTQNLLSALQATWLTSMNQTTTRIKIICQSRSKVKEKSLQILCFQPISQCSVAPTTET